MNAQEKSRSINTVFSKILANLDEKMISTNFKQFIGLLWMDTNKMRGLLLNKKLTDKEHTYLKLVANGNSSKEIAALLNVKLVTVTAHRKNILKKLYSKNIAQAIFNGMLLGLLPIQQGASQVEIK